MIRCLLVSCILCAATAAQTYQIAGTVVDKVSQRPIVRALVRLTPLNEQGQLTSLTAENGRFQFSNIPQGKYRLSAQRRNQRLQFLNEVGQYSSAVVVRPGLDSTHIVFSLHTFGSISGVVADQDGDPLPLAQVHLYRDMVLEGERRIFALQQGQTNSQGQFRFADLAAGKYYVGVQGSAWFAAQPFAGSPQNRSEWDVVFPVTYYGDTTEAATASPVNLEEGVAQQIQITLRSAPNIHVPIPSNKNYNPNTWMPQLFVRGLGGTRLQVMTTYSGGVSSTGQQTFELTGFAAGSYLVEMRRGPQNILQDMQLADGVPLAPPELSKSVSISGQVTLEGNLPVPTPFNLFFASENEQTRFFVPVDKDGQFTVSAGQATPGSFAVEVPGGQFIVKSVAAKGVPLLGDRIEVSAGSTARLSVTVAAAGSVSQLNGFAMRDDKPASGCMVLLVPESLNHSRLFRRDQSDSDGSFTMPAILPGKYTLLAIDDQGRGLLYKDPSVIQQYLARGQTIKFPLRSPEPVRISVQPRLP